MQVTHAQIQSSAWNNAVAMLLGQEPILPSARSVRSVKGRNDPSGKDPHVDLDELVLQVFGDDTDPMDCQEFDA